MKHYATKRNLVVAMGVLAVSACASLDSNIGQASSDTYRARVDGTAGSAADYGDNLAVRATIGTIKSRGSHDRIGSRAIRLPEQPLGEIAVFEYQFPATCGGHEFLVYEARDTQILEYRYSGQDGQSRRIRDYVTGVSPFIEPGLWGSYDHTADSISTMTTATAQRGDRMLKGVYSRGLVTGLPDTEQQALGTAYQRALSDVFSCNDAQAVANVPGE